ncbi:MAG: tRNA (adenosine(37)-N6)-threonylcarbamoyltransferase complex transferase subunit TsaD [Candidatus Anstonellales archaeon]
MIVLGIESTAHTIGVGICENEKILSNAHHIYKPINEGLIPRKMADHHQQYFKKMLDEALKEANIDIKDVDVIACAQGPGIGSPLSFGFSMAKYLSAHHKKPFIGVNHAYAHIVISELFTKIKRGIIIYVSGGNTQILFENEEGFYDVLGETLDIGIGNLFDSFGREIGLRYAHGSVLSELASRGKYIDLPYTVKGLNLAFSGLFTAAVKALKKNKKEDVAYSLMETSFAMVCEVAERAFYLKKANGFIVCGGVAQNRRLQEMLSKMAEEDGTKFGVAPDEFNRDNGAMIAYAGYLLYKKYGSRPLEFWRPIQNYRIENMRDVFR